MKITAERETGYGAGVLFMARDTQRALWIKRSNDGDYPGYWCCPGGGVEDNETIEQGVRRECEEELGFSGNYALVHMARIASPGFVYHNHLAWVDQEFVPVLNSEHTDYMWSALAPDLVHPGLLQAIKEFHERNGE